MRGKTFEKTTKDVREFIEMCITEMKAEGVEIEAYRREAIGTETSPPGLDAEAAREEDDRL